MAAQGGGRVEAGIVQRGLDVAQGRLQLAVEQDLLQPQQVVPAVVAIAVAADGAWPQQPQGVVVVQRPHRNARQLRHLFDRIGAQIVLPLDGDDQ
jgi:hypothetical protein